MNYFDIVNKAIELVIIEAKNGLAFLEPRYKEVLRGAGLMNNGIVENEELFEILKLEVEKRNAINNNVASIASWASTIVNSADEAMTEQENELMKNMMEYMRNNELLKEREAAVEKKELELAAKSKEKNVVPFGLNLAKRK